MDWTKTSRSEGLINLHTLFVPEHLYAATIKTDVIFLAQYTSFSLQLNIEPNHTTLAGHGHEHDVVMASKLGMLGSIDSNTGSPDLGWDTDQFPMDVKNAALIMKVYTCCTTV